MKPENNTFSTIAGDSESKIVSRSARILLLGVLLRSFVIRDSYQCSLATAWGLWAGEAFIGLEMERWYG